MHTPDLPPDFSYTQSVSELKRITDTLQQPEVTLEQALEHLARAAALLAQCQAYLDGAELKVQQLLQMPDGTLETRPWSNPY